MVDKIVLEFAMLEHYPYLLNVLENDINRIAKNPAHTTEQAMRLLMPLIDKKIETLARLNRLKQIFDNLSAFDKILLSEYIIKNKRDIEIANILNISLRTFYRKYKNLSKKINELYKTIEQREVEKDD